MNAYLTRAEVQAYAGVSRSTVERDVLLYETSKGKKGLRPIQRKPGAHRKFRKADVREWYGLDHNVVQLRNTA